MVGVTTEMEPEKRATLPTTQNTRQSPMNCPYASSRCDSFVVVVSQQPTEQLMTDNLIQVELVGGCWWWQFGVDGSITEPLMGAAFVIIGQPLFDNMPQVCLSENNKMVEALGFCSAHPSFRVGVQIGAPRWNRSEIDAIGFQN